MDQNHLTIPKRFPCHQRGSIVQRGNSALGERRVWLSQNLRRDLHIRWDFEAKERRARTKGPQGARIAPAHRASDRPPAGS